MLRELLMGDNKEKPAGAGGGSPTGFTKMSNQSCRPFNHSRLLKVPGFL